MLASIRATFDQVLATVKKKNHDYSGVTDPYENFRTAELVGVEVQKAILVRALDKISRMGHLLDDEAHVTEESFTDTGQDLIGYIALLLALREQLKAEAARRQEMRAASCARAEKAVPCAHRNQYLDDRSSTWKEVRCADCGAYIRDFDTV